MKKLLASLFLLASLVACSSESSTGSNAEEPKEEKTEEAKVEETVTLSKDEFAKMFSDPKKYKDSKVDFYAKIFVEPEKDDTGTYLQAYADNNSDRNILIGIEDPDLDVKTDDIIHVNGIVKDVFEGENLMGGTITAPIIKADNIEISDYATAFAPAIKTIEVNKEIDQHGFILKLNKIELAENESRLFVSINNNSQNNLSFFSFNSKIVAGNQQLEPEENWESNYPEIQSDILPGVLTEGIITFPALPESGTIKVLLEGHSDDYMLDFTPFQFDITY